MNEKETQNRLCANEACPRPAEPGETYCAECGLERSLYFRERREDPAQTLMGAGPGSAGR
jgi:hypothetical protein